MSMIKLFPLFDQPKQPSPNPSSSLSSRSDTKNTDKKEGAVIPIPIPIIDRPIQFSKDDYLVHQCNCVTTEVKGLAKVLFDLFPYANTYKNRSIYTKFEKDHVGTVKIFGRYGVERCIVNMYAQYFPGGPKYSDTSQNRLDWFQHCLNDLHTKLLVKHPTTIAAEPSKLITISIPWEIGCVLAKGNWSLYKNMIEEFAMKHRERYKITFYRYK